MRFALKEVGWNESHNCDCLIWTELLKLVLEPDVDIAVWEEWQCGDGARCRYTQLLHASCQMTIMNESIQRKNIDIEEAYPMCPASQIWGINRECKNPHSFISLCSICIHAWSLKPPLALCEASHFLFSHLTMELQLWQWQGGDELKCMSTIFLLQIPRHTSRAWGFMHHA